MQGKIQRGPAQVRTLTVVQYGCYPGLLMAQQWNIGAKLMIINVGVIEVFLSDDCSNDIDRAKLELVWRWDIYINDMRDECMYRVAVEPYDGGYWVFDYEYWYIIERCDGNWMSWTKMREKGTLR